MRGDRELIYYVFVEVGLRAAGCERGRRRGVLLGWRACDENVRAEAAVAACVSLDKVACVVRSGQNGALRTYVVLLFFEPARR